MAKVKKSRILITNQGSYNAPRSDYDFWQKEVWSRANTEAKEQGKKLQDIFDPLCNKLDKQATIKDGSMVLGKYYFKNNNSKQKFINSLKDYDKRRLNGRIWKSEEELEKAIDNWHSKFGLVGNKLRKAQKEINKHKSKYNFNSENTE